MFNLLFFCHIAFICGNSFERFSDTPYLLLCISLRFPSSDKLLSIPMRRQSSNVRISTSCVFPRNTNKKKKEKMNSSLFIIYALLLATNLAAYDIMRVSTNYLFIFIFSFFNRTFDRQNSVLSRFYFHLSQYLLSFEVLKQIKND